MTPATSRRKAQKKAKHIKYRVCPNGCDGYMICRNEDNVPTKRCATCGLVELRPWTGGGNGRRIP